MNGVVDWASLTWLRSLGMKSRWVETSMGRLHVLDGPGQGALPPIVLLHGLGARATHFRFLVKELLPHHRRIIVPDLLGHGLSDTPDDFDGIDVTTTGTEALLQLIDEPVVLFGNSMGGKGAILFASAHPDRVHKLVASAPAGAQLPLDELRAWISRFYVDSHADSIQVVKQTFARDFSLPMLHFVAWGARKQLNAPTVRRLLDSTSTRDCLLPEQVQGLAMPTLLLWGQQERMMEPHHLAWFEANLPAHARVERPDGYGHSPFLECPALLAEHILKHAAG
jgi:pimeloyl-ACP methyl ester carboxylesterase